MCSLVADRVFPKHKAGVRLLPPAAISLFILKFNTALKFNFMQMNEEFDSGSGRTLVEGDFQSLREADATGVSIDNT